jgi:hypothetical protein
MEYAMWGNKTLLHITSSKLSNMFAAKNRMTYLREKICLKVKSLFGTMKKGISFFSLNLDWKMKYLFLNEAIYYFNPQLVFRMENYISLELESFNQKVIRIGNEENFDGIQKKIK